MQSELSYERMGILAYRLQPLPQPAVPLHDLVILHGYGKLLWVDRPCRLAEQYTHIQWTMSPKALRQIYFCLL